MKLFKLKFLITSILLISLSSVYSQEDYCRWGKCKWGNDCMEGPTHIYGDHHPGCKTQWIKNNPEEWKEIQRKEAVLMRNIMGMFFTAERKRQEEKRKKREEIERLETSKKIEYVRSRVFEHIEYRKRLLSVYDNPETKRNFVVKYILLNNLKLTSSEVERFSNIENLITNVQKSNRRKVYTGDGSHFSNQPQLPSEYVFFPDGGMPSLDNLDEIGLKINKHIANLNLLKETFSSSVNQTYTSILKFQLFKDLNLPISKMSDVNSYSDFVRLFNEVKKKSLLNFENPNIPFTQTYETIFLTQNYLPPVWVSDALIIDNSLLTYFFGPKTNYKSLSRKYMEKTVSQNILDYTRLYGKNSSWKDLKMSNIIKLESIFFSGYFTNNQIPKNWNYKYSLISPYNRYLLIKDFAIVYNHLIKRLETQIEKKYFPDFKFKKLELSFSDYMKNEDEYLENLFINIKEGYVYLDFDSGYLVFGKTQSTYQGAIKRGIQLRKVIESYNYFEGKTRSGTSYVLSFEGNNILKGHKGLIEKHEESKKISNVRSNFNF